MDLVFFTFFPRGDLVFFAILAHDLVFFTFFPRGDLVFLRFSENLLCFTPVNAQRRQEKTETTLSRNIFLTVKKNDEK